MARRLILLLAIAVLCTMSGLRAQTFLNKTAGVWAAQLKSNDPGQRRQAAFALGKMSTRAVPVLKEMHAAALREKDARVLDSLLFALGEICRDTTGGANDGDLERVFLAGLKNADAPVRRSAAFALGCLATKSEATRKALDNALSDPEAIVRQNAAWALGSLGEAALPSLKKALRDADPYVQRDAAGALMHVKDGDKVHELLPELLPLCKNKNSEVRRAALNVLVRIVDANDKEAIPALKAALSDRDVENQRNAALTLSNIGGADTAGALPILIDAMRTGDLELRRLAAVAFRKIGPAAAPAVNDLIALLRDDPDKEIRRNAALSLGGIGKAAAPAISVLLSRIKDANEDYDTRIGCATALREIGPVPKSIDIVPDLLAFMTDRSQDSEVRLRVSWIMRIHAANLRTMNGPLDAYKTLTKEPLRSDKKNKMLRYDAAYMLGMIWEADAPQEALDLLGVFLHDTEYKIYRNTTSGVGATGNENVGGAANVKDVLKGDGRIMAVMALERIGPQRYAQNADIIRQLRVLAADKALDRELRKQSADLLAAAGK